MDEDHDDLVEEVMDPLEDDLRLEAQSNHEDFDQGITIRDQIILDREA